MNHVIIMPLWELLLLVVAVSAGTSVPSASFGARRGARMAIKICSEHNDCAMNIAKRNDQNTADLEAQLAALRAAHPEIAAVRAAMDKADTGQTRTRALEDERMDGHK